MLWFFFDTSAMVKRFHKERGTEIVDKIISSITDGKHAGIISPLIVVEFISAFRKKVNTREITWRDFADTVDGFIEEASANFSLHAVESATYNDAINHVIKYGLFASDSIHMATITRIAQTAEKSRLILVFADRRLCDSSEKEGFRTLNPEQVTQDRLDKILRE